MAWQKEDCRGSHPLSRPISSKNSVRVAKTLDLPSNETDVLEDVNSMDCSRTLTHFANHESLDHFAQLATPIWVFDVDNHRMWWANPAGVLFWEASNLQNLLQRDYSTDSDMVRARLRQVVRNGSGSERIQDTWTLYPNDEPKNVILSFLPIVIESGTNAVLIEVKQFVGSYTDAESLRILEAARASALMVSTFTADGRLLTQNPAALTCFGPPRTGIYGNEMASRLRDPEVAEQLLKTAESGRCQDIEQLVWTQNGSRVHRIQARRGRDPITGVFVTVISEEDVTEQNALRQQMHALNVQLERKVEERTDSLRASEERYALATQSAAIWDWDLEREHLYLSPSFIEALGHEPEAFRNALAASSITAFIHPEDAPSYKAELERHLKEPEVPFRHEHRFRTGAGTYCWYHALGKAVIGPNGRTTRSVGILTDISERKELEASLFSAQRLEAIGQLTGGLAHDFNNLLTVVLGNAELLDMIDERNHECVSAIKEAAQRGASLTRQLLAYSRKQTLHPEPVDLSKLVTNVSKTMLRNLGDGIEVSTKTVGGLWPIHADATQVESAILNLAINARDAMPQGGKLEVSCHNRLVKDSMPLTGGGKGLNPGEYVEIVVKDSGGGMEPETLERAFEPFFTTKNTGEGSGLGLSMVFGFSRQSGGGTRLESTPGAGTTVSVFLPRAISAPETITHPQEAELILGLGESIHLLEDDRAVQSTLRGLLESLNYKVTQSNTAAATEVMLNQGGNPDLILADVILPGGESGLQLITRLSKSHPAIKAVLMSGFVQEQATQDTLAIQGLTFVQKPMDKAKLSQVLYATLHPTK